MAEERSQLDSGDVLLWLRELDLGEGIGNEFLFFEAKELASQKIQDFRDGLDFPVIPAFVEEPFQALIGHFREAAEDLITEFNKRSTLRYKFHNFLIAAAAGDIPVAPGNNPDGRIVRLADSWNLLTRNVMHYDKDFRPFLFEYLGSALLKVSQGCLVFKLDHPNSDETRKVLKRLMAEHGDSCFIKNFQDKLTSIVVQLIQKELKEHGNISDIMELAAELKKYTQVFIIGRVKDLSPAATSCSVMVALSHEFDLKNDLKKVETEKFVDMALRSSTLKLDKERVDDMFCAADRCKSSSLGHIHHLLNKLDKRDKEEAAAASKTVKLGEASAAASKPGLRGILRSIYSSPTSSLVKKIDKNKDAAALGTRKLGEASALSSKPGFSGTFRRASYDTWLTFPQVGVIKPSEVLNIEYRCRAIAHLPSGQLIHGGTYGLVGLDFIPYSDNSTPFIFSLTVHADRVYVLHNRNSTNQLSVINLSTKQTNSTNQLSVINLSTKQTQTIDLNTEYSFHTRVAVSDTKLYITNRRNLVEVYRVDTLEHQYDIPLPDTSTSLTVLPDDTLLVGFFSKGVVRVRGDKSEYTELWRSGDCFDCFVPTSIVYDDKLDVMLCLACLDDDGSLYQLDLKGSVLRCDLCDLRNTYYPVMDLNGDDLYISLNEDKIFKYNIQEIRSTFTQPSIEDSSVESD